MNVYRVVFLLVVILGVFSCKKEETPHDAKKQALDDDKAIITYLETHYLNKKDNTLRTISKGETPIKTDIKTKTIKEDNIDYKLYYLSLQEGVGSNPKITDSVYIGYSGMLLDSTVFDSGSKAIWFDFQKSFVKGFKQGVTYIKSGTKVVNEDESFYFKDTGKAYIFMPSGLGYGNVQRSGIPKNSPLIFKINLQAINPTKTKKEE